MRIAIFALAVLAGGGAAEAGQTGGRHHQFREPLGSRVGSGNVGEIVPDVIWETLVAV